MRTLKGELRARIQEIGLTGAKLQILAEDLQQELESKNKQSPSRSPTPFVSPMTKRGRGELRARIQEIGLTGAKLQFLAEDLQQKLESKNRQSPSRSPTPFMSPMTKRGRMDKKGRSSVVEARASVRQCNRW
uniref:Uncharacterized protein n=1 Tax=Ascaris lumbricoides TaxID=6252 RepID=A0A9J2PC12_ASCLU